MGAEPTGPGPIEDLETLREILGVIRARLVPASEVATDPLSRGKREIAAWQNRRETVFGPAAALFANPAWDILVDLFVSEKAERPVSVSSACVASNVPATTGLRWLGTLQRHGFVERTPHPADQRSSFITLTAQGRALVATALSV